MNKSMIFGIAFMAALVAMAGQAAALNCNSFAFTSLSDYFGNPAFVYYENPDWSLPTVNMTLNAPGLSITSGSASVPDFSGDTYTWQLGAATPNVYSVTLTAMNSTDASDFCIKNLVLNLQNPPNPAISLTMDDVQEQVIGQAFNVNAYLNNIGTTAAYNATGTFDILNANSNSPQFTAQINSGSTQTQTFQVTSANTCTYYSARIQVDYFNQNGEQMASVYATDTFNVSGPDMVVDNMTLPASAIEGSSVTLSADVRNTGGYAAQGFDVEFYDGSPSNGTLIATGSFTGTLAAGASTTVNANWVAASVGNATIYAEITNSMECFLDNNQNSGTMEITASCGDGYCNGGESCGSCPSDCGTCPPTGGGGGGGQTVGGGGGGATGSCIMNYNCTSWSECTPEGIQTRICEYEGNCPDYYAEERKPDTERSCRYVMPAENITIPGGEVPEENATEETGGQMGGLTGFIIANPGTSAGMVAAILIIIGAVYYGLTRNGSKPRKNGQAFKYNSKKIKGEK